MEARARLIPLDGLEVSLWLHTARDPPPWEWTEICAKLARRVRKDGEDVSRYRVFIVSDGGAPNATQRKELFQDVLAGYPVPTAVVTTVLTTNPVKRGVATAMHLLNPSFRVFEPREVLLAVEHIGIASARFDLIWRTLMFLQVGMAPVAALELVSRELGLALEPGRPSQFPPSSSRPPPK
jgi:hypothetical protein